LLYVAQWYSIGSSSQLKESWVILICDVAMYGSRCFLMAIVHVPSYKLVYIVISYKSHKSQKGIGGTGREGGGRAEAPKALPLPPQHIHPCNVLRENK